MHFAVHRHTAAELIVERADVGKEHMGLKSPVRRIHKLKTASSIKETYSDEDLEKMRDNCEELRDLALPIPNTSSEDL